MAICFMAHGLGWDRGMENGCSGNQNFGAGANQIGHIFRTDSPIDFDPEIIALLSNSF